MSFSQEDVLQVVEQHGPVIPNQVKQRLGAGDATMINVYLSNLREEGKIKFTHVQLGSSKFAYTPQQKAKLETLIEHLNEKDRRTAKKLQEAKVLRVQEQDPLTRVGLQETKDFAIPIKVSTRQGEELFYRYFLTTPEQAQEKIREILQPNTAPKQEVKEEPPKEEIRQEVTEQPPQKPAPTPTTPPPKKPEEQRVLSKPETPDNELAQTIEQYCADNNIEILTYNEVRKNSEADLEIKLPTAAGKILFYAKAKTKKTSNDGDLAAAILSAKKRMLPALYLTTGSVTNKAKENPELQEITVVELGR